MSYSRLERNKRLVLIIDTHAHLGLDRIFDHDFLEEYLLTGQEKNGINVTIVQPGTVHDLENVVLQHNAIADLCRRYPGRFYGMANPNPHLSAADYIAEVKRCIEELGFIGLKVHPLAHAVHPCGVDGRRVFEQGARYNVPVMVHTGKGIPWSAPALVDPIASEYPSLPIIAAHAGGGILAAEALQLAQRRKNIYLELSWAAVHFIKSAAETLGADRLMFGSDHAANAVVEIHKIRNSGVGDQDIAEILGNTASKVYKLTS